MREIAYNSLAVAKALLLVGLSAWVPTSALEIYSPRSRKRLAEVKKKGPWMKYVFLRLGQMC